MARYRCTVCGEIYDEECEKIPFSELPDDWCCPLCRSPKSAFIQIGECQISTPVSKAICQKDEACIKPVPCASESVPNIGYPVSDASFEEIRFMAVTGRSMGEPMNTILQVPRFDEILISGAQLASFPKDDSAHVDITTVIGKKAKVPMVIESPVYISHMSFGSISYRAKEALAKGSASAKTAVCSGEGGALQDEMNYSYRYIFEYVPNKYTSDGNTLRNSDAIEIKIGQGTKPGMGGHLPGSKVSVAVSLLRGKPEGMDIVSPSRFSEIGSPEDLRRMVDDLRERSGGRPIGVKIAAGDIEGDLGFVSGSGCDFITIDGRGGATGSSPKFLKDATSVPTVYALSRARRYMDEHGMDQDLVVTGGLRTSGDFAKAIAMGADAVAIASAALMALGCERYRICDTGRCPKGIATQDPELEGRLDVEVGAQRVFNYLSVVADELRTFTRITGHDSIHDLSLDDLSTTSGEISAGTGIRHC